MLALKKRRSERTLCIVLKRKWDQQRKIKCEGKVLFLAKRKEKERGEKSGTEDPVTMMHRNSSVQRGLSAGVAPPRAQGPPEAAEVRWEEMWGLGDRCP